MTKIVKCRAKGGVTSCTDPNCPEKVAGLVSREKFIANITEAKSMTAEPGRAAVVTSLSAWLADKEQDEAEELLRTDEVNDWVTEVNAIAAANQHTELTDMLDLQEETLRLYHKHAFLHGDNVADVRDRLNGFKHARKIIDSAITGEHMDGFELEKILRKVRRQKNPDANADWVEGVKTAALAFNRIYGDEIYRANYNKRKSSHRP
jgi:hypothetical protein